MDPPDLIKKKSKRKHHYSLKNRIKFFYDLTLENLSDQNKPILTIKDNKIVGKISIDELKNMPWMTGIKLLYSSVPEPYTFELCLEKKGQEIEKYLTVYNGNVFLINKLNLKKILNLKSKTKSKTKSKKNLKSKTKSKTKTKSKSKSKTKSKTKTKKNLN